MTQSYQIQRPRPFGSVQTSVGAASTADVLIYLDGCSENCLLVVDARAIYGGRTSPPRLWWQMHLPSSTIDAPPPLRASAAFVPYSRNSLSDKGCDRADGGEVHLLWAAAVFAVDKHTTAVFPKDEPPTAHFIPPPPQVPPCH